ncbi:MAG: EcsC family protein [Lactobacillus sp.]|jgi:hypothetical protein|nr:EcsC family protein [Lactobacillus sp.]
MSKINHSTLDKAIDFSFKSVIAGKASTKSIPKLTEKYMAQYHDPEIAIQQLTKQMRLMAGASGFVTNLGGLITIPASLPTELVSVLYLDLRLVAGIAYLRGYELDDPRVQTVMLATLAGNAASSNLKKALIASGSRYITAHLSQAVLDKVNQYLRHFLLRRFTVTTATAAAKLIPLVSGAIGGFTDSLSTQVVGSAAEKLFKAEGLVFGDKVISRAELAFPPAHTDAKKL